MLQIDIEEKFPLFIPSKDEILVQTNANFFNCNCNHNRKLDISTAPSKAKSREPAYSQAFVKNKIDMQQDRSRESGRKTDGYGGWCLELSRGGR